MLEVEVACAERIGEVPVWDVVVVGRWLSRCTPAELGLRRLSALTEFPSLSRFSLT